MGKLFESYMLEQPGILREIFRQRTHIAEPLLSSCAEAPKRIFLMGSGSSYGAACAVAPLLREMLGCEITTLTPTMLADYAPLPDGLVLALSQTGTSTNTLDCVRKIKAQGRPVLLVTANADSPVGKEADGCVIVPCGEEKVGPKTKGTTATMFVLIVAFHALALKLGLSPAKALCYYEKQMEQAADDLEAAMQSGFKFYDKHKALLAEAPTIMLCADYTGYGASLECALKMLEVCRLPVYAYEIEELMHGVHYAVGPESTLFFLLTPYAAQKERMLRLADFAQHHGAQVYRLETSAHLPDAHIIADTCDLSRPLCLIAFFQALSARLSADLGIDCDLPRYPDFGKLMKTKKID